MQPADPSRVTPHGSCYQAPCRQLHPRMDRHFPLVNCQDYSRTGSRETLPYLIIDDVDLCHTEKSPLKSPKRHTLQIHTRETTFLTSTLLRGEYTPCLLLRTSTMTLSWLMGRCINRDTSGVKVQVVPRAGLIFVAAKADWGFESAFTVVLVTSASNLYSLVMRCSRWEKDCINAWPALSVVAWKPGDLECGLCSLAVRWGLCLYRLKGI
jgi:hypothetical protein